MNLCLHDHASTPRAVSGFDPLILFLLDDNSAALIYGPDQRAAIAELVEISRQPNPETQLIFSGWGAPVMDEKFLAGLPALKAVFYGAGSIRGIVTDAFWRRGIRITSAYGANAVPVAEYTLATILLSLKKFWQHAAATRTGHSPRFPVPGAYQRTVGVISLGMVGREVCRRLQSFDLKIIAYDPFAKPSAGIELVSLAELFRRADVVTLHTPNLPETRGMITGALVAMIAATEVMHWPLIGEVRPWQLPFLILGPLGMLVTIWMLRIPEPARQTAVPAATRFVDVMHWMRQEWRFYLMHTFGVSMLTLIFNGVAFWIPAHFMRVHGFGPIDVAFSYGPIMLIAGAAGIMAGGTLADRWRAAGKQDAELRVLLMSAILLAPLVALTFSLDDPRLALAMLIPTLFCSSFPFAAASAALQLVTPGPLRARASALYLLVINLTGIGIGATAMSMVSDYLLQDERRIGDGVIWVTAVAAPLAALLIGLARRAYRELAARGC